MLSRRIYFRLMLATAALLTLLGGIPRLVNVRYADWLDAGVQLTNNLVLNVAIIGFNYLVAYEWRWGERRNPTWSQRLARLLLSLGVAAVLAAALSRVHLALLPTLPRQPLLVSYYIRGVLSVLGVTLVQLCVDFFEQAQRAALENERLQREQLLARYEGLKQQVSPHFLFNSLGTLRWLIRDQPAAAERFVEEMSQVYRYLLQHSEQDQVPLRTELDFTLSYVYLLHMRFGESLRLEVALPPETDALPVPPLALQTLVENAVKHNVVSQNRPLTIRIFLVELALLTVQNNRQPRLTPEPGSGTGLRNLTNRLRFLHGTELSIEQDDSFFTVQLPLTQP